MAEFDTTNATATADDILNGKTAFAQGEKLKGTIQSKLGGSFTPTTEPQVICPAGVYTSSAFSIKGDANLKPQNIRKGVEIFGIEGTMRGNDTPSGTLPDNVRTISVEPNDYNYGTVHGGGAASQGMTITVNATPLGKYTCYGWEENGETVSEDAEYTFTVTKSRNLRALFADSHKPLPNGYTEVDWVQNINTSSYFHIAVSGSGSDYIEISFPKGMGNNKHILEYPYKISNYDVMDSLQTRSGKFVYSYYTNSSNLWQSKDVLPKVLNDGVYGLTVNGSASNGATIDTPAASPSDSQTIRIHYMRIRGHQLIPCINPAGTAGLYDLTQSSFIAPANGRFITIYDGNFYSIAVSSESNRAWGTVYGDGDYEDGSSVTVTAEPNEGYKFVAWKENGEVVSDSPVYTFTATSDRNLVAEFAVRASYSISVNIDPDGSGEVAGAGRYYENESVSLEATPNGMYKFLEWKENSEQVSTDNPYKFTAESNRNLIAEFANRIPAGYTLVEYVESAGKSYIDTGIKPISTSIITMDVSPTSAPTTTDKYFIYSGYTPSTSNATKYILTVVWRNAGIAANTGVAAAIGSYTSSASYTIVSSESKARRMVIGVKVSSRTFSVDDTSKTISGNSTMSSYMSSIKLLAYNTSTTYMLPAKIYSCQMYEGSKLIRDFIPCVNPEDIAGLYDTVEDVFYPSASSTDFTAGPTVE